MYEHLKNFFKLYHRNVVSEIFDIQKNYLIKRHTFCLTFLKRFLLHVSMTFQGREGDHETRKLQLLR